MNWPKFSIVTPTRNMAEWLPDCIESVRKQTYRNVEHVVIDACSDDGTVELLEDYPHLQWISEPDTGQSNAINKGFAMATGDVLTWLNADDRLAPGAIEHVAEVFRSDRTVGWVYGDLETVSGDQRWVYRPPDRVDDRTFSRGNVLPQPGTFFTRAALEVAGGIDEDFNLTMDFELWLRFVKAGVPARHLPVVLASFAVHPGSKTGSEAGLAFAQEEFRALLKNGYPHRAAMAIDRWHWDDVTRRVLALLDRGAYREVRRIIRQEASEFPPILGRPRLFLLLARLSPRLAKRLVPLRRTQGPDSTTG